MDIDKPVLKFTQRGKIPRPVSTVMEKKVRGLTLLDFETYHTAIVIKMS